MFRKVVFKNLTKPVPKLSYFSRSERSKTIFNVSENDIQKHSKPNKKNMYFNRSERSITICNVSEATASKPFETNRYFNVFFNAIRNKWFGASGGSQKHKQIQKVTQNAIHAFSPGMPIRVSTSKHSTTLNKKQ